MNIVTKKRGEKNARKNFSRNTLISRAKNYGKNRLEKVRNHVFYKHTNIVIKQWGGGNKISKNTRLGYPKIVEKKSSGKVRKHVFYKHTNIVTKK